MKVEHADVAVIGAGIVGLACAYYISHRHRGLGIAVIDQGAPMSLTSSVSGENYRNWWPHRTMTAFTDYSIGLMEEIARASQNRIHLTRRGYALATRRADPEDLFSQLVEGYGGENRDRIRFHTAGSKGTYQSSVSADWQNAPDGVDVLQHQSLIRENFPTFDREIQTILHIRRAGDVSGQQLGSFMLEHVRSHNGVLLSGRRVVGIERSGGFSLTLEGPEGARILHADVIVNAAGPHVGDIAEMLGEKLPATNVFQQKIAFADAEKAIPRTMPFSIDLDGQTIDWTEDERSLLLEDPKTAWLARPMPGAIHCRPDGGDHGSWIKLGWAYNRAPTTPTEDVPTDPNFPDIVLRGASRLNPRLRAYYGRLPRQISHYGGYYTMTEENWPLIGPMRTPDAFIAGALSGFGTMGACAAGALCAAWVWDMERPAFASQLSFERYSDKKLMNRLLGGKDAGVL
jgi:glycine/D-amino acid oxidase-like deaminating enzyme